MGSVASPQRTHAFIVAIEKYDLGDAWKLDGVSAQGEAFARWLINDRGVPPKNLRVFVSGADQQAATAQFTRLGATKMADGSLWACVYSHMTPETGVGSCKGSREAGTSPWSSRWTQFVAAYRHSRKIVLGRLTSSPP